MDTNGHIDRIGIANDSESITDHGGILRGRLEPYDAPGPRGTGDQTDADAPALGYVAAWVGGSHAHGLADAASDIDLHAVILPGRSAVLLGEDMGTRAFHEPDLKITTPLALMRQLAKGMPNALEWLAVPSDCDLTADGPLRHWARYARALTCPATLRAAMGNAGANLRQLDAPSTSWNGRKMRKVQAETMRLLHCVRHALDGETWPCRLPSDETLTLREIRREGCDVEALRREYNDLAHPVDLLGSTDRSDTIDARRQLRQDLLDLYAGVVTADDGGAGDAQCHMTIQTYSSTDILACLGTFRQRHAD